MNTLLLVLCGVVTIAINVNSQYESLREFANGNIRFSADIYKEMSKTNSGAFLICPFSVENVLALLHAGAKGQTAQELSSTLHLPNTTAKIHQAFRELQPIFRSYNPEYNLDSANKIYAQEGFNISTEFKAIAENIFSSDVENVDFSENVEAASRINKWVEEKTHNKIKNIMNPDLLSSDTVLVLVNALYFKAEWENPFDLADTKLRPFYANLKRPVNVQMMKAKYAYEYYESPEFDAKFLQMNYYSTDIVMTIVLPNKICGLAALEAKGLDKILAVNLNRNHTTFAEVQLPRFKVESTIAFNPILWNLGIRQAFGNGDLSGLSSNNDRLALSHVIQKTFIKVGEDGTEAAASTIGSVDRIIGGHYEPKTKFIADHPFIFSLKHRSGVVLFVGRVTDPVV